MYEVDEFLLQPIESVDEFLLSQIQESKLIDIIISKMQQKYLNNILNSDEQEIKLREANYLKLKQLPDLKAAFQSLVNEQI